jgi:spheroidene monooxygenase
MQDQSAAPVAVMALVKLLPNAKLGGIVKLMFGRYMVGRVSGLQFIKHLGAGVNGGFSVQPSTMHQGLFALFSEQGKAEQFLRSSPLLQWYREHAEEFFSVQLQTYSCKGTWAGRSLPIYDIAIPTGPIASLTRASIRPWHAREFWLKAPPAETELKQSPGCILAAGVGEAPLLRQATFTIWQSEIAMNNYARSGSHLKAIQAAYSQHYFSESMFARFKPMNLQGTWAGHCFE